MSVESIALVLNHSRARGTAKLVLLGIANHDGDGGSWPTIATLARYAGGVDERTVRRSIGELEALGEIVVHVNGGGGRSTRNDQRPNLYELLVHCPEGCDRTHHHRVRPPVDNVENGGTQMSARRGDGGTPVSERGDTSVRNGGTPVSAEPSKNHPSTGVGVTYGRQSPVGALEPVDNPTPGRDLGGRQPVTPMPARADRCGAHQLDGYPPPCLGCKRARENAEAAARADLRTEAERARLARLAAVRGAQEAIARCAMCDEEGYRHAGRAVRVCDHDPHQADVNRRGVQAVKSALAAHTAPDGPGPDRAGSPQAGAHDREDQER
ncbi:MAG TPA: helix-turn-helix domain-containing protein [Cellulomonas sp.]